MRALRIRNARMSLSLNLTVKGRTLGWCDCVSAPCHWRVLVGCRVSACARPRMLTVNAARGCLLMSEG